MDYDIEEENDLCGEKEEYIFVTFKYGGFWVNTNTHYRKRYNGGKQRTVKIEKGCINLFLLKTEIVRICPWLKGHHYNMHFHIHRTSPKEYKIITSDIDVVEMVKLSTTNFRAEIVISVQEVDGEQSNSNLIEAVSAKHITECSSVQAASVVDIGIGTFFSDAKSFKNALRSVAIRENFGVQIKASDKKRVIATCSFQGCQWRIRASVCEDTKSFQVRRVEGVHTCPGINRAGNRIATSAWVANEIQEMVKRCPDIPPKEINNGLEKDFGLSLSYMKLWRAREQARDEIFGSVDDNYKWVPTLTAELLDKNPGSHITYACNTLDNSFQRLYVSFKVCADGFLLGCRPLISLDACHLKSKYLGVLLSANSVDGNNGLFTLAYAVVETESKHTWSWFLQNLGQTIGTDLKPLCFISDMEKGLGEAVRDVYPEAEHRVCIRHLWKNLKKNFHCKEGHKIHGLVWAAANSYTNIEFNEMLEELSHLSPTTYTYLISLPYKWSRSQFMLGICHAANTNNFAESFNSWINDARTKPAVDLVDMIRGKLMEQRAQRKMSSLTWQRELVPNAEEYLRDITTRKDHFIVRQSTIFTAEVEGLHSRHIVDIERRDCTCRVWQLIGLPCIHAVAFIGMKEHPLWHTYVDEYYYVSRYRLAYDGAIGTLSGKEQWRIVQNTELVGVPNTCRPRGRPRKRRLLNFLEQDKRSHRCGRCGLWGHHRSTCKNPLQHNTTSTKEGQKRRAKLPSRRIDDDLQVQDFEYSYVDGL